MLFGADAGQGIEHVGVVRRTFFDSPVFHGRGDSVGNARVEWFTQFNRFHHRLEDILRKPVFHHLLVEDIGPEKFAARRLSKIQRGRNGLVICDGLDGLETGGATTHRCTFKQEQKNKRRGASAMQVSQAIRMPSASGYA